MVSAEQSNGSKQRLSEELLLVGERSSFGVVTLNRRRVMNCIDIDMQSTAISQSMDASMQLGQERHITEVCSSKLQSASMQLVQERQRIEEYSSKLQEIERELQEFSDAFGSKLQELKKSMGEFAQSMKELIHYDEGTYIEDRLWEEADADSMVEDAVASTQSSASLNA